MWYSTVLHIHLSIRFLTNLKRNPEATTKELYTHPSQPAASSSSKYLISHPNASAYSRKRARKEPIQDAKIGIFFCFQKALQKLQYNTWYMIVVLEVLPQRSVLTGTKHVKGI